MRVLLISTNRYRRPQVVMPMGACLVAEAVRAAGHQVRVLDLMFAHAPRQAVRECIRRFSPEVIGLSIRNLDNNDSQRPIFFLPELKPLLACIRQTTAAKVVLGGAAVGLMPESLLRYTGADAAVVGNGEQAFVRLLAAWEQNHAGADIPGYGRLEQGRWILNPPETLIPDRLAPDFTRYLSWPRYRRHGATVSMQTKRGCPFDCVYCTYALQEGRQYRLCEPAAVAEAVRSLYQNGIRDIEFVDNVFNAPYRHALDICRALERLRLPLRLQSIEINPGFLDRDLLQSMKNAGFVGLGITAESVADKVLQSLGKNYSSQQVEQAVNLVRRQDIPIFWIFLLGGPGEDDDTARQTLEFAQRHIPGQHTVFFQLGVRIYPGTPLEAIARREGMLKEASASLFQPTFYLSPRLDLPRLQARVAQSMARHLNFTNWDTFANPWLPVVNHVGRCLGLPQPLWRHSQRIRGFLRGLGWKV